MPDSKGKLRHGPVPVLGTERRAGCSLAWLTWSCQPEELCPGVLRCERAQSRASQAGQEALVFC